MRAVSYIRQSKQREDDSQSSPQAQRTKCEALITAKGWDVAGHFSDVGKSGWDPNTARPAFEELMSAVRGGEVDAVIVFSLSRLTRQGALDAMLINDELQKHGVRLVSVEEPYLDTSTPMGVAIFGLIAALAQQESDMKSAYISATKETLRAAGSHVSGIPPFGFTSTREQRGELTIVKLVPHPVEAEHVRAMVKAIREGKTSNALARELNALRVPTKSEGLGDKGLKRIAARRAHGHSTSSRAAWTGSTVVRVLRDPRLAGFAAVWEGRVAPTKDAQGIRVAGKVGKRVILRDDTGAPIVSHEPIISPDEWWALQDVLDGRTKVVTRSGRRVATLLAGHGFLLCDVCESVMVADLRGGVRYYKCNRASGSVSGHGGLTINMEQADDEVSRRVWSRLTALDPSQPDELEWLAEAARRFAMQQETAERDAEVSAARAELEHVRAARATLYDDREAGDYDGETGTRRFREANARLRAHEDRVLARIDELTASVSTSVAIPSDWTGVEGDPIGPGTPWASMSLEDRRSFLAFFVDTVRIAKSVGRGRHANTRDRVLIRWAEAPNITDR
ncbi:recombinase family protein [Streptomyces sp. NPDC047981]|uniref:recombinase family protein n=1 Tax=Streptomyces sp. NPDC047981 TaxID=3154610 RepID=UPI0034223408